MYKHTQIGYAVIVAIFAVILAEFVKVAFGSRVGFDWKLNTMSARHPANFLAPYVVALFLQDAFLRPSERCLNYAGAPRFSLRVQGSRVQIPPSRFTRHKPDTYLLCRALCIVNLAIRRNTSFSPRVLARTSRQTERECASFAKHALHSQVTAHCAG